MSQNFEQTYLQLRRAVLEKHFSRMNDKQREAVFQTEGPVLILAGAGSGKTTVLIHRVANLMKYGRGSDSTEVPEWVTEDDLTFLEEYVRTGAGDKARQERLCALDPAAPWTILAITFTNKAAGELKDRLARMLGRLPTISGPAPFTPPVFASSAGILRSWASPPPLPSMTLTTPCGW